MDQEPTTKDLAPLIVLSGPSGVGKTTLIDELLHRTTLPLRRAVTATTRPPRPGERDGVHYHFWTPDAFRAAIAHGEMLEWAEVHGRDYYGTPRDEVDPYRERGVGVILVIDVQGAGQIRAAYQEGDYRTVFIYPPTFDELRHRLVSRGESEESIRRRLETAHTELARRDEFDCQLENADLTATVAALERLICTEFQKRGLNVCSTN
jgi:guanylate kinase